MPVSGRMQRPSLLPATAVGYSDLVSVHVHRVLVVARLVRCEIPRWEERHDVRTRSYPVVRGQKSNSNRIHSGRSNYMDSRHHTFAYARDRARMLSWHASSGRDLLMARLKACDLRHRQAAIVVILNRP
jgi:hypothetical protein